jgi:cell division protein FtsQ
MNKLYKFRRRWFSTIVVFMIAIVIVSAISKKQSQVTNKINVTINNLEDEKSLITTDYVYNIINKNFQKRLNNQILGGVDLKTVELKLEEDNFIKDANVYLTAANDINIIIDQRKPILRIIDNKGLNYYMDIDGKKFSFVQNYTVDVPVATGYIPAYTQNFQTSTNQTLNQLYEIVKIIQKDVFYNSLVQQIYVDEQGEFTLVPIVGDQKIKIGKLEDFLTNKDALLPFYQQGMSNEGWDKYKIINLKYKGQVVAVKK